MLTIDLECSECHQQFKVSAAHFAALGFKGLPRACPACNDRQQERPEITLHRETLWNGVVRVGQSFGGVSRHMEPWEARPGDTPVYRALLKGSFYGADWSGRIDVYSHVPPDALVPGAIVLLAHNRVRKEVWSLATERPTMEHGVVEIRRRVAPGTEGAEKRIEEDSYVTIVPLAADVEPPPPVGTLVFVRARTKTTIKGFGRQYWAHIEGMPVWSVEVSGGYRSGRASTRAMLAVQADDAPIAVVHSEGGAEERWVAEAAGGL